MDALSLCMASVGGDVMHVGSGWWVPGSDRQQQGGGGSAMAAAGWWWSEARWGGQSNQRTDMATMSHAHDVV
ncbi:hypothetical protein CVT25_009525 [Psilocybe cyanescens]|uniref:Uncharacterized protein n=1 Tax=Psilocybe cyanescens TaxID=93625 RepID=A0A409WWN6_PSICY|nr:hypothetical protein CVT25_009525 [Psilocybe cyanescens]